MTYLVVSDNINQPIICSVGVISVEGALEVDGAVRVDREAIPVVIFTIQPVTNRPGTNVHISRLNL